MTTDNDETLTQIDTALHHIQQAIEILQCINGMEQYAERIEHVALEVEMESQELETLED